MSAIEIFFFVIGLITFGLCLYFAFMFTITWIEYNIKLKKEKEELTLRNLQQRIEKLEEIINKED